ncbi:hypothetical protein HKBW3S34_02567, partial [Candidatus Hakubella thermalkaliphila]
MLNLLTSFLEKMMSKIVFVPTNAV